MAHPLVGAWSLTFPDEPGTGVGLIAFTGDGLVLQANPGRPGQGVWEATGEHTAAMTLLLYALNDGAERRMVRVRARFEVDGDALTGSFTNEAEATEHALPGQSAPLRVAGTRTRAELPAD